MDYSNAVTISMQLSIQLRKQCYFQSGQMFLSFFCVYILLPFHKTMYVQSFVYVLLCLFKFVMFIVLFITVYILSDFLSVSSGVAPSLSFLCSVLRIIVLSFLPQFTASNQPLGMLCFSVILQSKGVNGIPCTPNYSIAT